MMAAATETAAVSLSSEEILKEVRNFVKGSTLETKVSNEDLVRSALLLLRTLPSARHAVLEHLCNVFDEAVNSHILQVELGKDISDNNGPDLGSVIEDVQMVLMGFVKNNPDAWAPIISAWSIELLGQISSKYAGRRGVPQSSSLNELLQLWMTCRPTKVLIEIASQCFASMVGNTPDVCVDALLEASVKHSPHFDWVVAHIGSCFPTTIITRVLMCGLKDFFLHGNSQAENSSSNEENIPKMASVVGILGHLASRHGQDIRKALLSLFEESLKPGRDEMEQCAVPFLLHLASLSPMLLQVITTDFVQAVTPEVLNQLASQLADGKMISHQEYGSMTDLVVHLITQSAHGAYKVLQFLLNTATPPATSHNAMEVDEAIKPVVQQTCSHILDKVIIDLQRMTFQRFKGGAQTSPFLQSLQKHTVSLCKDMLLTQGKREEWLCRLLCCVAAQCGESCAVQILSTILKSQCSQQQLGQFLHIQSVVQAKYPQVLSSVIQEVVHDLQRSSSRSHQLHLLNNLLILLKWDRGVDTKKWTGRSLCEIVQSHLVVISSQLVVPGSSSQVAMEVLCAAGLPQRLPIDVTTKLCCAVTDYFFRLLQIQDTMAKLHSARSCQTYFTRLCHFPTAQKAILRLILESSISKEYGPVFGSKVHLGTEAPSGTKAQLHLLEVNKKQASSLLVPQSHATVFHGGVIGQGLKPLAKPSPYSREEQLHNKQLFLEVFYVCCCHDNGGQNNGNQGNQGQRSSEGMKMSVQTSRQVALLLIELIAPDVMYNGIPWPEEEFMRVTVERDLQIRKMFDDHPVLWDVMDIIADGPGAMCYCSCLMRSVTATLMSHLESCRDKSARNNPHILNTARRLLNCMRKGGLLPPPLSYVGEMFAELTPYEVFLLLQNTWRFIKERPPVPDPRENALRVCERYHIEVIRCILHKNIGKLGHLYARFFSTTAIPASTS